MTKMLALFWIHFTFFGQSWEHFTFIFYGQWLWLKVDKYIFCLLQRLLPMCSTNVQHPEFCFCCFTRFLFHCNHRICKKRTLEFRIFDIFDWIESICFMWIWEGPEYWSCKSLRTFMSFPYIDPNPEGQTERKDCLKENYVCFQCKNTKLFPPTKKMLNLVLDSAVRNNMEKI